jgi:hypothetical protein
MNEENKFARKKTRVTLEKLTQIRGLYREGMPIVEIARVTGLHRHTIRTYIKEKFEDVVADEARKDLLTKALEQHFKQIREFAQHKLRSQITASVPQTEKKQINDLDSISIDGTMGLPERGTPQYMAEEWHRMYYPSPRESHLMKSLRTHTKESNFWTYYDKFRQKVSVYENLTKNMWNWLDEQIRNESGEVFGPEGIKSFQEMVFGNILNATSTDQDVEPDVTIRISPSNNGITPITKTKDSPISLYAKQLLKQAQERTEWSKLKSATDKLTGDDSQRELKQLVRDIDEALVSIELMYAFPNRCELCPI